MGDGERAMVGEIDPGGSAPAVPPPRIVDIRLIQANERTMLAWVRTGVTIMAFGFVIARTSAWLDAAPATGATVLLGGAFIAVGTVSNVIAAVRYLQVRRALLAFEPLVPRAYAGVALAAAITLLGVALGIYLVAS